MQKWSKQIGLDIDKAPFFTENSIKDIVGLNFNPGEAVPTFSSAQSTGDINPHVYAKNSTGGRANQGFQGRKTGHSPHGTVQ